MSSFVNSQLMRANSRWKKRVSNQKRVQRYKRKKRQEGKERDVATRFRRNRERFRIHRNYGRGQRTLIDEQVEDLSTNDWGVIEPVPLELVTAHRPEHELYGHERFDVGNQFGLTEFDTGIPDASGFAQVDHNYSINI